MFGSGGPSDDGDDGPELPFPDPPAGSESDGGSTSGEPPTDEGSTSEGSTSEGSTDEGSTGQTSTGESSTSEGETETGELEEASTGEVPACDQPAGVMTPVVIPDAQVGVPYEVTFSGPDGVYLYDWFTLVGAPPGLALTSDSQPDTEATLAGTPTTAGFHDFIMIANPTGDGCVNADALIVEYTLEVDP